MTQNAASKSTHKLAATTDHAELRKRYVELYDLAPVGYFTLSEKNLIVETNLTAADMLGVERRYLLNQPWPPFIVDADQNIFYQHRHKLFHTNERQTCELRISKKNGKTFCGRLESVPARNADGALQHRSILTDITARKEAEESLKKAFDEMEFRVQERTAALQETNKDLERAIIGHKRTGNVLRKTNEELENLVHIVSHDLKTSLVTIKGFSSRLIKNYHEKIAVKGLSYLKHINSNAHRMEALVSDLLTLSTIGRTGFSYQDVSVPEIVHRIVPCLKNLLNEKGIRLMIADNIPLVRCDGKRIHQVIENLLINAVKYMGNHENPKIEIGYKDRDEYHQFFVRDNGLGIDPKHHRDIFKKFVRLKAVRNIEGNGLGLTIVERIITSHGGKVWVESEKGEGATFYFTLPHKVFLGLPIYYKSDEHLI